MPNAIVVGGGIAGLVMARDLALGGLHVTLLEASDHLGGKVARHTVAGIDLDAGAESFATRRNTVEDLAKQLGLGADVARPNPRGAWLLTAEGLAHPMPRTGILGIPGIALAADVIEVVGFWGALRGQLDALMFGFAGSKERNLGRLVRRRMGRRVLERLVAPVTLGIHSRHPDELDVDVVAPGLRAAMLSTGSLSNGVRSLRESAPAGTAVSGLVGGIFSLVEALTRDLERFGVRVRLNSPVAAISASTATLVDGQTLQADTVVLAAPLTAEGAVAATAAIVLATLVVDAPELDAAPRGTGVLVARPPVGSQLQAKALTHGTAKWDWLAARAARHRHVLRLSYDGAVAEKFTDSELRDLALRDAGVLLGVALTATSVVEFARVHWSAPADRPAPIEGVTVIGEGVAGTGLAAVIAQVRLESGRLLKNMGA
ncbi:NAD(P)/FAD-dependent oxidoreductase [Frigoribacterium sp. CG_9.8]|uniref:protoporphyrinogen/coproporphyrinogen oxidase n=1 Tax=Frigoribacterium sp. CG_9.8 TaxID=2787733 RepID=UPI0018C9C3D9|nr:FAD-dependent oxidoreductase [Frigoribacterium sp. CG_9.8]MBG6108733.1 oxygen-dependent protoporphyrinogen oxidase [Frigoribacterium sp. CG_9.8]